MVCVLRSGVVLHLNPSMYVDYAINQEQYIFSNATNELPIGIELLPDRSGESIESFTISLMLPQQPISTEITSPNRVTVIIIDDDCKPSLHY